MLFSMKDSDWLWIIAFIHIKSLSTSSQLFINIYKHLMDNL